LLGCQRLSCQRLRDHRVDLGPWLLAVLPDPAAWCADPTDSDKWSVATQKSAAQIGLLVASPYLEDDRQQKYGAWVEERLATPTRVNKKGGFAQDLGRNIF
jgi:hypothetical protein